jgi:putative DNA primase/helicase
MTGNGRMDGARALLEAGWVPVPIPPGKKGPVLRGWEQLRPSPEDLPRLFAGEGNVGVLLGEPSGGLVDVDLDCPEARALADLFLPPTGMEHGRASAPRSHRWYLCTPAPPKTVRYRAPATPEAPKGATLVELRSTGGQTVVPPSVHPSGEPVAWTPTNGTPAPRPGEPAAVPSAVLGDAVAELAAAALLARAWPAGARHDAALALAGGLARAGWEAARAVRFVLGVARAAGDDELRDRERAVRDTVAAAAGGTTVTGLPSLAKLVSADIVSRAATWLRIGQGATGTPLLSTAPGPDAKKADRTAGPTPPPSLATALAVITAAPGDAAVLREQVLALGHQVLAGDLAEDLVRTGLLAAAGLPDGDRVFREALDEARRLPAPIPRLSHKTPARTARAFLAHAHVAASNAGNPGTEGADEVLRLLHHYRGEFFRWRDAAYALLEESSVRADLWDFLEAGGVAPNSSRVSNAVDATRAACYLDGALDAPCWLGAPPSALPVDARPRDLVPLRNGILHPTSGTFVPPTSRFFTLASLPFDYDPADAAPPERWLAFLAQLWPEDPEAIETLQEMFGYLLTPDTSLQKMFLLVGPRRSGKGTIGRVLRGLLGEQNVAGPTLTSLAGNFGLAPLIGKACALVSDARLSGKLDQQVVVERLLSISGEDALTIDRKYTDAWTGQLRLRFVLLSNELPRLADASSALPGRFIILRLTQSFYGEEDPGLLERLLPELPRILHWALAGRQRLKERGYFVPPSSSADLQQEMEELASPIQTFLRERCELRPEATVSCERLFFLWEQWCRGQGRDYPGTVQSFARDIRTAVPDLVVERVRGDGARRKFFRGIGEAYGDA